MAGFDIGAVDRHIFSVLYVCESFLCDNIGSDHVCKVSGCFFCVNDPSVIQSGFHSAGADCRSSDAFFPEFHVQGTGIVSDKRLGRTVDILIWQRLERSL